ncbi:hypothetical protein FRACA_510012 [Frankia canadensis]|uniref:Uncharacterized protein n=1 Tax=Frankia canadensis TaxID=1836972 RepID=A0A2I2KYG7_9ACTN|nr:hypothetical protein FRACA_510012 [Frankia canadensis]SOU58003.1 hypothetical protein FRACA_510012 [Frankia canadensis]
MTRRATEVSRRTAPGTTPPSTGSRTGCRRAPAASSRASSRSTALRQARSRKVPPEGSKVPTSRSSRACRRGSCARCAAPTRSGRTAPDQRLALDRPHRGRRQSAGVATRSARARSGPTLTTGEECGTLSLVDIPRTDAEREKAVTAPSLVLRRSHPVARYGACCL